MGSQKDRYRLSRRSSRSVRRRNRAYTLPCSTFERPQSTPSCHHLQRCWWAGLSPHCFLHAPLHLPSLLHNVSIWIADSRRWSPTMTDMQARVSLLSTKDRTSGSWTKQARPGYRVKSQDTAENHGPTTSEQTRGPISDATEETWGKLPSRTVQTLETGLVWQPRLILGQPHWKLPLPSIQCTVLLLIMRLNHLRSLVKRPLEHVPVGWSEPLHVIMNIPVEQDYHIEHRKATNQQVHD